MILTIDVGIKNLALCVMSKNQEKQYIIHLWNNYDVFEDDVKLCQNIQKNGKQCNKRCSYKIKTDFYCKPHFPKDHLPMKKENHHKQKLIKQYLLQDIAKAVIQKLNTITEENKEIFEQITKVLVELQPHVNPRMKFISHIIYGKLT